MKEREKKLGQASQQLKQLHVQSENDQILREKAMLKKTDNLDMSSSN
jgi:hypothetical protein